MRKNGAKGYAILGILFVLVSIIAFVIPTMKTTAFFIAYAFTVVAFAVQIGVWRTAFSQEKTLKSKFLGLPIIYVGAGYLLIQIIALAVFLFDPMLPMWSAITVCAIITGLSMICIIAADIGRSEIGRTEEKVQKKVLYIKELQSEVEMLADSETDAAVKTALIQLAEKIRFSDPMSHDALSTLEEQIAQKVAELKSADDKKSVMREIDLLLTERNKKCKIHK